ncbi:hypothetical protein FA95DRAFT_116155 [Auriscalpium vulgare]|uniref:Uncharacterized protein n=1 Tax=Auriscalpium vulgare TaxID=40419 RepID=A0ACB8RQ08_9AGAM|nr:hypothetical protein FA95DRAFT_116155 [Auriscalpium vulgare]
MLVQGHTPEFHLDLSKKKHADPSTSDPLPAFSSRPLLLIKVTGIRVLSIALIAACGISKAILFYQGQSTVPTAFELVSGVLSASLLYWLSLFEAVEPPVLGWLLHDDYAFGIVYFARLVLNTTIDVVKSSGMAYTYARTVRSLIRLVTRLLSYPHEPEASTGQKVMFYLFPVALIFMGSIATTVLDAVIKLARRGRLRHLFILPTAGPKYSSVENGIDVIAEILAMFTAIGVYFWYTVWHVLRSGYSLL